jgi:hypothetical protein
LFVGIFGIFCDLCRIVSRFAARSPIMPILFPKTSDTNDFYAIAVQTPETQSSYFSLVLFEVHSNFNKVFRLLTYHDCWDAFIVTPCSLLAALHFGSCRVLTRLGSHHAAIAHSRPLHSACLRLEGIPYSHSFTLALSLPFQGPFASSTSATTVYRKPVVTSGQGCQFALYFSSSLLFCF